MLDKKNRKRIEGVAGLGKTVLERNPIAHALVTAKEIGDSTFKIRYGEDPRYLPVPRRFRYTPKPRTHNGIARRRIEIILEEDPLKRMLRQTRNPETKRILRRLMA